MKCPKCQKSALVHDSRAWKENTRRRRYSCSCGHKFGTMEQLMEIGKGYRYQKFNDTVRKRVVADIRAEVLAALDR